MSSEPLPAPRTCQKHGVMRDPFGHCVLCRREDKGADDDDTGARTAGMLLVVLAVGVGGVLVYKGTHGRKEPPPPVVAVVAPPAEAPPIDDLVAAKEEALAAERSRDVEDRRVSVERYMKEVPIVIYTTKRCDTCRAATAFLTGKGYAFTDLDIDESRDDLAAMRARNPKNTVPTMIVGDEVIVGFGPSLVLGAIYRDAAKRVHQR